ncbi:hypothetical protein Tco_0991872 [Tanacetum coccineum]|uniref:Transposase (Putative), gypsy type n=1 Tax=Tanacetum coccineum TaxID=301880 RepID=A0ABQ5F0L7_9ASTR
MSLSAEVRMRAEYNVKEKRRLKSVVERQATHLRAEASNFEAVEKSLRDESNALKERNAVLEKEQNALDVKSQNYNLVDRLHEPEVSSSGLHEKITVYENCMDQLEKFQDERMKVVNDKFDNLYTDFVEMALHLGEKFYPHLLTTISGRRWLLTHCMELAIINCLNSPEYLSALGAAIGKAIKKGMQDGLSAEITHGKEGRVLTDVAAYNPSAEDASVKTMMDILRLKGPLAKRLGLNDLQPNVDQLMIPIHSSPDQVVVGATTLSLALDVSSVRAEGTSDTATATADTNTTLSTTFAFASTIAPISVDDYEVIEADNQAADENATSFPNVDDAELNIPRYTFAVLSVGMPISIGMTVSVSYVNENGVSLLLDFIMVRCAHKT